MFVLDLRTPGVTIRPFRQMNGAAGSNDVFFEDVHIPADRVLGQRDNGWPVVMTTLEYERTSIGAGRRRRQTSSSGSPLEAIASHLQATRHAGLAADPLIRQRLAELFIQTQVTALLGQRLRAARQPGESAGPWGSLTKLARTRVTWLAAEVGASLAGSAATAWERTGAPSGARWAYQIVSAPASGIAGGTSEVVRTIVGERILGLPREPRSDRENPTLTA